MKSFLAELGLKKCPFPLGWGWEEAGSTNSFLAALAWEALYLGSPLSARFLGQPHKCPNQVWKPSWQEEGYMVQQQEGAELGNAPWAFCSGT